MNRIARCLAMSVACVSIVGLGGNAASANDAVACPDGTLGVGTQCLSPGQIARLADSDRTLIRAVGSRDRAKLTLIEGDARGVHATFFELAGTPPAFSDMPSLRPFGRVTVQTTSLSSAYVTVSEPDLSGGYREVASRNVTTRAKYSSDCEAYAEEIRKTCETLGWFTGEVADLAGGRVFGSLPGGSVSEKLSGAADTWDRVVTYSGASEEWSLDCDTQAAAAKKACLGECYEWPRTNDWGYPGTEEVTKSDSSVAVSCNGAACANGYSDHCEDEDNSMYRATIQVPACDAISMARQSELARDTKSDPPEITIPYVCPIWGSGIVANLNFHAKLNGRSLGGVSASCTEEATGVMTLKLTDLSEAEAYGGYAIMIRGKLDATADCRDGTGTPVGGASITERPWVRFERGH